METIPAPDDTMPGFQPDGYHDVLHDEPVVYSTDVLNDIEPALTHVDPEGVTFWLYQGNAYRMCKASDAYLGDAARDVKVATWAGGRWSDVGRWRLDRGQQDDVVRHPDPPSIVRAAATVLGRVL